MRIKWMPLLRKTHLFLGVFFTPMLLMFILTGWWQTITTDDEKEAEGGFWHNLFKRFSSVHTDDIWQRAGVHQHHEWVMKSLVISMCVALILSLLLGLALAWQTMKHKWVVALALALGILVPVTVLYFG